MRSNKYRPFTKIDPGSLMLAPAGEVKVFLDENDGYLKGKDESGNIVDIYPPQPVYVASSAGAGDAGKAVLLDGSGKIDNSMIGVLPLSKLENSSVPTGTLMESNGTNWAIGRLITISSSSPSGGNNNDIWFKI